MSLLLRRRLGEPIWFERSEDSPMIIEGGRFLTLERIYRSRRGLIRRAGRDIFNHPLIPMSTPGTRSSRSLEAQT